MVRLNVIDGALEGARETDVVILVIGPTKAGKSTLLNQLLPEGANLFGASKRLASCTVEVSWRIVEPVEGRPAFLGDRRLVLVDTPGFDDTDMEDEVILGCISKWSTTWYNQGVRVAGVLYVHDIPRSENISKSSSIFNIFTKICGDDAMNQVAIVTTKWSDPVPKEDEDSLHELCKDVWSKATGFGAQVCRLQPTDSNEPLSPEYIEPWEIIRRLLVVADGRRSEDRILLLQHEMVKRKLCLPETSAGRELGVTLKKLLRKAEELKKKGRDESRARRGADLLTKRRKEIERLIDQIAKQRPPGYIFRVRMWLYKRDGGS